MWADTLDEAAGKEVLGNTARLKKVLHCTVLCCS